MLFKGVSGNDAVAKHAALVAALGLPRGAEAFDDLLVKFEVPARREVHKNAAPVLQAQTMPRTRRMTDQHANLAAIPSR